MRNALDIDRRSGIPIYVQLTEQLRLLIHAGALKSGEGLPTVRQLAVELGINANTVARVYRDLQREGLLRLERGVGTFVTESSGDGVIDARDFRSIESAARKLVDKARTAGLTAHELAQLIETLWKEKNDAEG